MYNLPVQKQVSQYTISPDANRGYYQKHSAQTHHSITVNNDPILHIRIQGKLRQHER